MNNPNEAQRKFDEFKMNLDHQTRELSQKKDAFKKFQEENIQLINDIKNLNLEIKQKEEETKKIKQDIANKQIKMHENEKMHNKLKQEIDVLTRKTQELHADLSHQEQGLRSQLGQSGIKLK